jgi:hypothetical protein
MTCEHLRQFEQGLIDAWAHQLPWADFNSDDRLDGTDYTIWQQHFGSSVAAGADGDANGDGYVDATDYTLWRDQLGQSDVTIVGAAAPEPGTLMLLVIGASALCVVTRTRHHTGVGRHG